MKSFATLLAVVMCLSTAQASEQTETIAAIKINGQSAIDAELIHLQGEHILFDAKRWQELGVILPPNVPHEGVLSTEQLGLKVVFHSDTQTYDIIIPPAMRPLQTFRATRPVDTNLSASPKGVMLGYDLSVQQTDQGLRAHLAHDARMNIATGTLYHTGRVSKSDQGMQYERGLTTWSKDLFDRGVRVQVGDVYSSPRHRTLNTPTNMGGVRIGTDRGLIAEPMYPVPVIAGVADNRSTAEIVVNGRRAGEQTLEPGPYAISQLFYGNGLNEVTSVLRDDTGQEHITTRTVYTMPQMVKKGAWEWDLSMGKIREGNTGNFYGQRATVGSVAYGVNDRWTMSAGVQSTQGHQNVSVGSIVSMGQAGALSVEASKGDEGHAFSVAYERRHQGFGIQASHMQATPDYWQLGSSDTDLFMPVRMTSAGVSYATPKWDASVSYIQSQTRGGHGREDVTGRFRFRKNSSNDFSLAVTQDLTTRETSAMVGWHHRFGPSTSAQATHQLAPTPRTTLSAQTKVDVRGVHVDLHATTDGENHFASARAPMSKGTLTAELSNQGVRVSAEGGLWVGEGGVIPTQRSFSSYVVVETEGQAGIAVQGPGLKAETNKRGVAVFPNAPALLNTPVNIDQHSVALETQFEEASKDMVAPRHGGAKVNFVVKTERMREYQLTHQGKPLEDQGSVKTDREETVLGVGGLFVLMEPKEGQVVEAVSGELTCKATLPALSPSLLDRLTLDCKETP